MSDNEQKEEGMIYISLIAGLMGVAAFVASMVEGFRHQGEVETVS